MDWRPFKLLNAAERDGLARSVRAAAADWLAEWLPSAALGEVRCRAAAERAATRLHGEPPRWIGCADGNATLLAFALDRDVERLLAARLFGDGAHGALVGEVIAAALGQLGRRLLGRDAAASTTLSAQPPAAGCWQRGSGAAIVEIELDAQPLALLAAPSWVLPQLAARARATPPVARAAPTDPRQCIGHAGVRLQAWAGSAAIELGLLQTLAPGDVIRLDARIDQPLRITLEGRETGRRGHPGTFDGRRAIQLAALR